MEGPDDDDNNDDNKTKEFTLAGIEYLVVIVTRYRKCYGIKCDLKTSDIRQV